MTPAELRIAAEIFHQDSKTRARLLAFADVVEEADTLSKGSISGGAVVTFPAHLVANLDQALSRVETLQP